MKAPKILSPRIQFAVSGKHKNRLKYFPAVVAGVAVLLVALPSGVLVAEKLLDTAPKDAKPLLAKHHLSGQEAMMLAMLLRKGAAVAESSSSYDIAARVAAVNSTYSADGLSTGFTLPSEPSVTDYNGGSPITAANLGTALGSSGRRITVESGQTITSAFTIPGNTVLIFQPGVTVDTGAHANVCTFNGNVIRVEFEECNIRGTFIANNRTDIHVKGGNWLAASATSTSTQGGPKCELSGCSRFAIERAYLRRTVGDNITFYAESCDDIILANSRFSRIETATSQANVRMVNDSTSLVMDCCLDNQGQGQNLRGIAGSTRAVVWIRNLIDGGGLGDIPSTGLTYTGLAIFEDNDWYYNIGSSSNIGFRYPDFTKRVARRNTCHRFTSSGSWTTWTFESSETNGPTWVNGAGADANTYLAATGAYAGPYYSNWNGTGTFQ